jgi:hypothetical protein
MTSPTRGRGPRTDKGLGLFRCPALVLSASLLSCPGHQESLGGTGTSDARNVSSLRATRDGVLSWRGLM